MSKHILIVDDELTQQRILEAVLTKSGFETTIAQNGQEALELLNADGALPYDLMVLDLSMPKVSGLDVLNEIRPKLPDFPIIVLTALSSINTVVEVMQAGATDFLIKPASAEKLRTAIDNAFAKEPMMGEIPSKGMTPSSQTFDTMIGSSGTLKHSLTAAMKVSNSSIPVLIEGESGVGKEVFAQSIAAASDRGDKPLVTVNCGAIPDNLIESILFGHEKGAFTGANEKHIGKFQEASGGTLFLDEVGELPLDMQVKLLRALQEGEVDPVGATTPVKVDFRLISATNRNLADMVGEGTFREDLFYRLNVFPLTLPPLRERQADIPELVEHFIKLLASKEGLPEKSIASDAIELLTGHPWPGNVRQLQNTIFRAMVLSEGDEISAADFPQIIGHTAQVPGPIAATDGQIMASPAQAVGGVSMYGDDGEMRPLADIEGDVIREIGRAHV